MAPTSHTKIASAAGEMDSMKRPGVTAVIVNFNSGDNVVRCVRALMEGTRPVDHVLVVDNGSTDGSREAVARQFPAVRILALGANQGLSAARNAGLQAVETEYALLVDDDVYMRPETVANLLQLTQGKIKTILAPRIILFPEGDIVQAQGAEIHFCGLLRLHHGYQPLASVPANSEEVGGAIGACFFGRTDDFTTPGGFDDQIFFYFEDLEFSLRLRSLGYDFRTAPTAPVDHERGAGTIGLSFRGQGTYPRKRAYYSMRHRWLTILIHYQLISLILLAPSLILYELLTIAFFLRHGWPAEWLRAWHWLWQERATLRSRRRRMQRERVRRDRDLLTDGEIPLAPGLIQSRWLHGFVRVLTAVFNLNWRLVRSVL